MINGDILTFNVPGKGEKGIGETQHSQNEQGAHNLKDFIS